MRRKSGSHTHEIIERGRTHILLESLISDFKRKWEKGKEHDVSISDFVPVRLVTILETHIRYIVQRIVDHGEPYVSRGAELLKNQSKENLIDSVLTIKGKNISLGHIVSQGLSINDIDSIKKNLTNIFGEEFVKELSQSRTRWIEDEGQDKPPLIKDKDKTFFHIKRLLETRNILVHEMPRERPYSEEEIPEFLSHAAQFGEALEWLLTEKIYGTVPRTQTTMNLMAIEATKIAQKELDELRGGNKERFNEPNTKEEDLEYHWDRFCELSAQKEAGYLKDSKWHGTIAPLIASRTAERLIRWRISDLEQSSKRQLSSKI